MDDALSKTNKFGTKMVEQGAKFYNKAKCHPWVNKHVTPIVESPLLTFPLIVLTWPCGLITDPCLWLCPCTCIF